MYSKNVIFGYMDLKNYYVSRAALLKYTTLNRGKYSDKNFLPNDVFIDDI